MITDENAYSIYTVRIVCKDNEYPAEKESIISDVRRKRNLIEKQIVNWYNVDSSGRTYDIEGNLISRDCFFIISKSDEIKDIISDFKNELNIRHITLLMLSVFYDKDDIDYYPTVTDAYREIVRYETNMIKRSAQWLYDRLYEK